MVPSGATTVWMKVPVVVLGVVMIWMDQFPVAAVAVVRQLLAFLIVLPVFQKQSTISWQISELLTPFVSLALVHDQRYFEVFRGV